MPTLDKPLSTVNRQTYASKQGKITKPVDYKAGKLQAKGPIGRLLLRMKATLTGTSYQQQIRGSVDKALASYAKAQFNSEAKANFMKTASKAVGSVAQLHDAVDAIHEAAGDVIYAQITKPATATPSQAAVAGRSENHYELEENPYELEENPYELGDYPEDEAIYSEIKVEDKESDNLNVDNDLYSKTAEAPTIEENELYQTSDELKDAPLYDKAAEVKNEPEYDDIGTVAPAEKSADEPEYDDIVTAPKTKEASTSKEDDYEVVDDYAEDHIYEEVDLRPAEEDIYEDIDNLKR